MSITDKINQLTTIRGQMRTKLVDKGVAAAATHNFSDFVADLDEISGNTEKLPDAYQEVEYIRMTGTQFIRTDLYVQPTDIINAEISLNSLDQQCVYCARTSTQSSDQETLFYINSSHTFRYDFSTGRVNSGTVQTTGTRIKLTQASNNSFKDDVRVGSSNFANFTPQQPLHIGVSFVMNGSSRTYSNQAKADFYPLSVWNYNGTVCRAKYKPCYRKADNVAGMYDYINDIFYTNAGTGNDFGVGPNVT